MYYSLDIVCYRVHKIDYKTHYILRVNDHIITLWKPYFLKKEVI